MAVQLNGFVKIHRKLVQWGWYTDNVVKGVFLHILLTANFKPMEWQGRTIFPGQLVTSVARMGADLGFTRQQIRTALDKLKSTNEITVEATNRFSVITVVNWDEYQFYSEKQTNKKTKPLTVQQPSNNQQITIKQPQRKNDKKYTSYIKEEKKVAAPQEVFPPGIETQEELEALKARLRE